MTSGTQPSRALLIIAGALTQLFGAMSLVLALAAFPVVHDLKVGMGGVTASIIASVAAIVCGTLVWRGRLVPLALAAGLDVGFGIGLAGGGVAIGGLMQLMPAEDLATAETLSKVVAILMFIAAVVCVIAVPSALKLRQWARAEIAKGGTPAIDDETVPTKQRPRVGRSSGSTLRGIGPMKLIPTQVIRVDQSPRRRPLVIAGVAVTAVAIGVIIISAATGGSQPEEVASTGGSSVTLSRHATAEPVDDEAAEEPATESGADPVAAAAAGAPVAGPPVDDFVARFHVALGTATAAELAVLFETSAFAFGVGAHDLAEGRDAAVAQLRDDLGAPPAKGFEVRATFSHVASEGDVGWLAEELEVGSTSFVITAVLGKRDGAWRIGALHWARAMPNETAYRLVREGEHAIPDAIPDTHDSSPLATATRTAFASKPSLVEARSARPEAINFGTASGERLQGGETIKRIFARLNATIRLRDAVKVGMVGERGGWGVANVDFIDADTDGTEITQTFRVLAAWVKEDTGWRIVQTQWSSAR